jgi:hypothetical protein
MDPDGSFFFASVTIRMKEKICADQIGIYSTHPPSHMSPYFFKKKITITSHGVGTGNYRRPYGPPSPARARRGPGTKRPSPTQPDGLRARAGRHSGLRSQPSTQPSTSLSLNFRVGPAQRLDDGPTCRWAACQPATWDQEGVEEAFSRRQWRRRLAAKAATGDGRRWCPT